MANVTVTNNGAIVNNDGKIGKCYEFNGSSKIICDLSNAITSPIGTLACWVKFKNMPSSSYFFDLIQVGNLGGYATCLFGFYMEYTNYINISINGSSTGTNRYTHSLQTNTWYHIATTYDGTIVKLYIDGNEVFSKTATISSYNTAASHIYLGGTSSYYLNGYMNDARWYDEALSPKQIKLLSQGLVLHYPLSRVGGDNLHKDSYTLGSTWVKENCTVTDGIANLQGSCRIYQMPATGGWTWQANTTYTVSIEAKSPNNAEINFTPYGAQANSYIYVVSSDWKRYSYTFTSGSSTNTASMSYYSNKSGTTLQLRKPKLEIGDHPTPWIPNSADTAYTKAGFNNNIEYDVSGYDNNGTITGTLTYSSDTPKYNTSTIFNGSQYIKSSNEISTDDSTISLWIKVANLNASYHILDCRNSTENGKQPIYNYTDGSIQSGGSNSYVHSNSGLLVNNTWVHIVLVQSGNTLFIYKNGTLFQTLSCTNSPIISPTIGARFTHANYFKGQLSDFRIYATALSADDILELYNTPVHLTSNGALLISGELTEV